ncbi:MAG: RHS domain-containing protein [Desulfobulbaceae bacterium]|nr:RHS domain-containing protein [Desulfobulbaceae bacterium]
MKVYGAQAGIFYFVNDHLGTLQKIVDSIGTLVWEAAYLPLGQAQLLFVDHYQQPAFPGPLF